MVVADGEIVEVEWGTRLIWPDGSIKVYRYPSREYAERQVRGYYGAARIELVRRQLVRSGWSEPKSS